MLESIFYKLQISYLLQNFLFGIHYEKKILQMKFFSNVFTLFSVL